MSESAPIESLAGLRARVSGEKKHDPGTTAAGGMVVTMLLALPLGVWLGTDAGALGGVLGGLGWWLLLVIGVLIVASVFDSDKSMSGAVKVLAVGGALAGVAWFLLFGDEGLALPLTLALVGPAGGILALRGEVGRQADMRANQPLGLSEETIAACLALPEEPAEPLSELLDRAVADIQALGRFIDNGMLEASGQSVVALRGDVDRALQAMARKALVADTMLRRGDQGAADPLVASIRRIGEELDGLTDAALVAAASAESAPADLTQHIESLRLTTASRGEIEEALSGAGGQPG